MDLLIAYNNIDVVAKQLFQLWTLSRRGSSASTRNNKVKPLLMPTKQRAKQTNAISEVSISPQMDHKSSNERSPMKPIHYTR